MAMKTLAQQMAFYQGYHRTWGCKATHYFGVPLVTFALLIPMGWLGAMTYGHHLTLAMLFVFSTLIYYFLLAPLLATIMTAIMVPVTLGADRISRLPLRESALVFGTIFLAGVVLQLIGHFIEGKRPALVDNFMQAVFTAPLFLVAEALMALGWKGPAPSAGDDQDFSTAS